ncbi:hypothetical protein [Myroides sp. TSA_177.3]|uniref:hypothetical protein n=1 Tax=Myroides sp. TSA_177.3 TaxID=3415650 RepID=UPI004045FFDA
MDSQKIAKTLRAVQLQPIHILKIQTLEDRSLVRTRNMLVKDLVRLECRVRAFLHFYGIDIPIQFKSPYIHWPKRFIK